MNDLERRKYVQQFSEYKRWIALATFSNIITAPDAAARLSAIEKAFAKQEPLPDIRDLNQRPNSYEWKIK